jgi:signal transduction histidine kinase
LRQPINTTSAEQREVERVRHRFERLLAAGLAISSEHDLGTVLQQVVDRGREVVAARYSALGVLAPDEKTLSDFLTSGLTDDERARIGTPPEGRGLLGLVIREGRPIRSAAISAHPRRSGFPPNHPSMESFLGVPIVGRHGVFGNLYFGDKIGAPAFDEEDEGVAVLLAAQAAVAVENARLYRDTTELLEHVQAMQRQRNQFFAMVNHELRNALTGIYGWAERLVRPRGRKPAPREAHEVFEAAERTIELLNNLLDLSRLDAGKMPTVRRDVPAVVPVRRAHNSVQPAADAKAVQIVEECPDPSPVCETDDARVEQILVNLLSNAVRHSPAAERVVVRVEQVPGEVRFHVIDRGPGIASEAQAAIFEPFVRVGPQGGLGSGLGLPVSRRLAEMLGGRLSVHSAPGSGATFTLTLPAPGSKP